jgi:hypothetical protein
MRCYGIYLLNFSHTQQTQKSFALSASKRFFPREYFQHFPTIKPRENRKLLSTQLFVLGEGSSLWKAIKRYYMASLTNCIVIKLVISQTMMMMMVLMIQLVYVAKIFSQSLPQTLTLIWCCLVWHHIHLIFFILV